MTEDPQKQYEDTDDEETTGAKPILSPWKKTVILWSVILLLIGGGAAATYFGAREVLRAKASMDWPTTQGKSWSPRLSVNFAPGNQGRADL